MNAVLIIAAYLLIIIIDLPYFFREKNKTRLMAVYSFLVICGIIAGILLGRPEPPVSLSDVIANMLNLSIGSD
ncbi:MAG: hypothetical protein GXX01_00405 [Clostridiales bacterium]|jgi:H+/Cl- antiporter ClcA|nr:hypothetical protein [Clostridiales bacterium]